MMKDEALEALRAQALRGVWVSCNEFHAHSALEGCLQGNAKDITILKLIETVIRERNVIREVVDKLTIERGFVLLTKEEAQRSVDE